MRRYIHSMIMRRRCNGPSLLVFILALFLLQELHIWLSNGVSTSQKTKRHTLTSGCAACRKCCRPWGFEPFWCQYMIA